MQNAETPPPPPPSPGPTDLQQFAVLLRSMNSEFNRIAQEFAHSQGLHLTDVQALIAILDGGDTGGGNESAGDGDAEPMTPGRLRKHLNLTSGAMTACLDRLEKAGHIRRVRAADDRRVVHLHYAEGGKEVARDFFRPLALSTDAARGHFSPDELAVVVRFLTQMNRELALLRR